MLPSERTDPITATWLQIGKELGVEIIAPFTFEIHGRLHVCIAYLPHFGGSKGIVLDGTRPPRFEIDEELAKDAKSAGHGCSFLNTECYQTYDREAAIETLSEWGFYGPSEDRPAWLAP